MAAKTIYIYECWSSDQPSLMGCLYVDVLRGKESVSYEYETKWLKAHPRQYYLVNYTNFRIICKRDVVIRADYMISYFALGTLN